MKAFFLLIFSLVCVKTAFPQGFLEVGTSIGLFGGYQYGEYGGGVSFVDFNQDGLDDLTIASGTNDNIRFFVNSGSGFEETLLLENNLDEVKQVLWVDYDNDGDLDLYVTNSVVNKLYKNTGNLNLVDITATTGFNDPWKQSFCSSWLDYDEDGLPDLCVSHRLSHLVGNITLYHNLGNDQFEDVTIAAGLGNLGNSVLSMTTFDFNNDGLEDIYVGQDYQAGNILLKNMGDGTFDNISASSNSAIQNNSMTTTIGDFNGDGWMDIYLTSTAEGNSLLENQGDETFIEKALIMGVIVNQFCWGALFLDADNDMDLDLFMSSTYGSYMFENQGGGLPFLNAVPNWGFQDDINYSVGNALGDFNADGRVDFAENNKYPDPVTLWQNNFTENNYLAIDLQGSISNSMALGALIDIFAGGVHQIRRIGCGEGFSSQNSYTQFFGLAANTFVDEIKVTWPNGQITTLNNIAANGRITIVEDPSAIGGCTDIFACNYDPSATYNNGSCYYAETYFDCDGNCLNDIDQDGICDEFEIQGCTDPGACNFDPAATDDNGSCVFPDPFYDCDGNCLNDIDQDGICDELEIAGCQDPGACNFDPAATDDDGSCSFLYLYPINGNSNPATAISILYTYPETIGSNYFWEVVGGEIISGQGTAIVEIIWEPGITGMLSITETNAAGCAMMATLSVDIILVGLQNLASSPVQLYPNPVSDLLFFDLRDWFDQNTQLSLYDINGRKILDQVVPSSSGTLNMGLIPNGVYQIVFKKETETITSKIVVCN
ncbi:MAG: VCBS repeat-containing protein [Saprospiraceae bacterium]|nr:VCBS repeat-containing protein [Saprospiraceae bacterium]